jgi:carbonic anhydrase
MSTSEKAKPPRAVVTCMDYRVKESVIFTHMRWDDGYVIRNAGAVVTPEVIRSLTLLQKFVLNEKYDIEVAVVAHTGCGMSRDSGNPGDDAMNRELERDIFFSETAPFALESFDNPQLGVRRSVQRLLTSRWVSSRSSNPLKVHGRIYDVDKPDDDKEKLRLVKYHIVQTGQDWDAVAAQHGISPDTLKKENPQAIRPDNFLGTGQVLYIP